ncbi:MAG: paraquat-inducible protein A [Thiotrichales bacterium]
MARSLATGGKAYKMRFVFFARDALSMPLRVKLSLALLLIAFACLIPGITQPMLTLNGSLDKARVVDLGKQMITGNPNLLPMVANVANSLIDSLDISGRIQAYEKTRSILGTVRELFDSGNPLVGFLIMLFSVIVPVTKGLLILLGSMVKELRWRHRSIHLSNLISKWSMADVFVVAIVVAFLAANASRDMGEIFMLEARLGSGFYFFLGYCLLSVASAQLMVEGRGVATDSARQAALDTQGR